MASQESLNRACDWLHQSEDSDLVQNLAGHFDEVRAAERAAIAKLFEAAANRDTDSLGIGIYGQGMRNAAEFIRRLR